MLRSRATDAEDLKMKLNCPWSCLCKAHLPFRKLYRMPGGGAVASCPLHLAALYVEYFLVLNTTSTSSLAVSFRSILQCWLWRLRGAASGKAFDIQGEEVCAEFYLKIDLTYSPLVADPPQWSFTTRENMFNPENLPWH